GSSLLCGDPNPDGAGGIGRKVDLLERLEPPGKPRRRREDEDKRANRKPEKKQEQPSRPAWETHRAAHCLPPSGPSWDRNSASNLRASASFRALAWSRILTTESGSRCLPSAFAWAVAWKRFRSMYRSAETSASSSSVGSAGRSRAAFKASSRGVTLVAMVLARRTGRASPLGEAGDCNGAGMRGVLMGKPASKPACTLRFCPSSAGIWKPLFISAFTHRALSSALCVYARKRRNHCEFADRQAADSERVDDSKPETLPVYRQHPIWG